MPYVHTRSKFGLTVTAALCLTMAQSARASLSAETIVRQADRGRGLANPYKFTANIYKDSVLGDRNAELIPGNPDVTVVEVRSDGFARQLILVLQPNPGDVLLKSGDVIWLRPRRLHRLTRIPPDLRMFNGAATSDVVGVDLVKEYVARLRSDDCGRDGEYVLDLTAAKDVVRYPRVTYRVGCDGTLPRRIDLMTLSGKVLKTITYGEFTTVIGQRIATRLAIEDHVFKDVSVVRMSAFALLESEDLQAFNPDYLLSLPDLTGS